MRILLPFCDRQSGALFTIRVNRAFVTAWAGMLAAGSASELGAQLPGLPVLQSPFVAPQRAAALNFGQADDLNAVGAAGAWAPASARVQLSAGLGRVTRGDDESPSRGIGGGLRAYLPLRSFAGEAIALGVFTGIGGDRTSGTTTLAATPIGATVGYRRALGATRALSAYVVPFYSYTRQKADSVTSGQLFRFALGADVIVVPRVGLTLGYEGGATAQSDELGVRGGLFGAGLSYAF